METPLGSIYYDHRAIGELFFTNQCDYLSEVTHDYDQGCYLHDLAYHNGGTSVDRARADKRLLNYFKNQGMQKRSAYLIYLAIRFAGKSRWNTHHRDLPKIWYYINARNM
jgi:hypothetical protein